MAEWMREYLDTVAGQIRWRRARPALTQELAGHLEDQYDALREAGMPEEAARAETLRQMGDAVRVGQELDLVHKPKAQWGLLVLTVAVTAAGALLRSVVARGSPVGEPERVVFYLLLGLGALFGCYFLDYSFLGRHAVACYGGAVLLGILCLIVSPRYGGVSYYTRYFVTMLYPLVYGALVYRLCGRGWPGFLLALAALLPMAVVCMAAPSMLGLMLLGLSGLVMLVRAIWRGWFRVPRGRALAVLAALAVAGVLLLTVQGVWHGLYRRLILALQPGADPQGAGYLGVSITEALSHAALWGPAETGRLLPAWDTDSLLASMICRLGWIPVGLLCAGLLALLVWAAARALRQKNVLAQLLGIGILLTLGVQMLLSAAMNLGVVLLSATCPFIMGNLHTVLDLALMGVLLSAFRQERLPERGDRLRPVGGMPRMRWQNGELVIRLGPSGSV